MFKRVISLLFVSLNIWAAGPLQSDRSFKNTGGKIDHISPLLIPSDKAADVVNFMMDDRGQLTARPGFTIINATGTLTSTSAVVTGGAYQTDDNGNNFFAIVVGTNVYRTSNSFGGSYTRVTATTTITASATNLAQHASLNNVVVFCNETDTPFKVTATTSAYQLVGVSTGAKTCAAYGNYLLVANTSEGGTSFPSRVRWSDINTVDSWPALNYIDIETGDGDKIVSMVSFKDSVYVFKQRSIYRLMTTGLAGADAFIVRPFSRNIGCWAKNSVRVIPNLGIAFLAQNTLYVLGDNELSSYNYSQLDAVGDSIQRTFDSVQRTQWANAVGAVYPKRYQYLLAVSTAGTTNSEILAYDYIQKSWTTYTGSFSMLEQAQDSIGNNLLVTGDYNGNNYKLDEAATQDKFRNVATGIGTSYTTGWLSEEGPDYTKGYKYLYVFTQQSSTASLTVQAAFDYSNTFEYTQSVGLGNATALYDTAVYDTDTYALSGYAVNRFEINRDAKAIKLMFTSASTATSINLVGYSIVYINEDFKQ